MDKLTDYHQSKLSEYLQSHLKKTSLSLKIKFNSNNEQQNLQIMKLIEEELSQLTHLTDLALHISKHSILTTKGYLILSNAVLNLLALKKLSIKIDHSCFLENEGLQTLQDMINHLPELIELNLEIFKSNFTTAECAQKFLDSLGINNTKLKTLNLNFQDIQNSSTNEGNIHFWRGISNLNNLEMLKIYLNTHSYGFSDIIELFELIANLEQLKSLHLIFYNEYGLDNRLLDELFPSIGKLTELRSLTLNYNFSVNLTDAQRKAILRNLIHLIFLEQLEINELHKLLFKNNCQEYLYFISNLKNLKMINWDFNSNQLSSEQITSIGQTLFQLENLVSLELVLIPPINNECEIYKNIKNWFSSMHNLRSFNLEVKHWISDIIINNLATYFKRVEGLEMLKLKIIFPSDTNRSFLLESIRNQRNLKKIDLIFQYEDFDSDYQFTLLESIAQLQQLERLYLDQFQKVLKKKQIISNFEVLCNTLINLPKLKYLKFGCQVSFGMKEFNMLEKCFQNLQNLEFLSIDLEISYSHYPNDLEIKSVLNHLPNLKEIEICFIDHSFNIFGPSAANLLELESCSLYFRKGVDINQLNQILESLSQSSIQKLHLDFFTNVHCKEQDPVVFSKINSLQKLFIKTQSKRTDFMRVLNGIKQTKQLNSLSLETSLAFTEQDVQVLDEILKSLRTLKKFNFSLNSIIDQDIDVFSLNSLISYGNLKHFQCDFFNETEDSYVARNFKFQQAFSLEQNQQQQQQQQLNLKSLKDNNIENHQIQFGQPSQLYLENQMKSEDNQQVVTQLLNPIEITLEIYPQNYKQLLEFDQNKFDYLNTEYLTTLIFKCNFYQESPVELQLPYQFRDLTQQSKLITLKFILEDCIMNEEIINYLSRNLKYLTNLQYLELSQKYSEDYYHLLFDSFQYLTNLLQIKIKTNLSENGAISLGNSLKSMRKLEFCGLIFEEQSTFDSNGFYSIFNGLKQATRMKELTLTMSTQQIIENEDSELLLSECISNMKLLQQLSFTIGTNQINQTSLREFFTSIGSLIFLKTLILIIKEENPLNQEMLDELIKAMNKLTNLNEYYIQAYLESSKAINISQDFATFFNNKSITEFNNLKFQAKENLLIFKYATLRSFTFQSKSFQNLEVSFIEYLNKSMIVLYQIQVNTGILKNLKMGAPRKISQIVFYLKDEGDIDSMCEFILNIPNIFELNMKIDLQLNLEVSIRNIATRLAKLKTVKVLDLEISPDVEEEELDCPLLMIAVNAFKKMEQLQEFNLRAKNNASLNQKITPKIKKSILRLVKYDCQKSNDF